MGKWPEAEKAFHEAVTIRPEFSVAMLAMGSLFLERTDGDLKENAESAKQWLIRSLDLERNVTAFSLLGTAHYRLGEIESARRAYRAAIEADGSYEEAQFNLGVLEAERGDEAEAERLLRGAINLDPNYRDAHGRLGVLLQKQARYTEAEAEFRRCIEIKPSDDFAHLHLAEVLARQGRVTESEREYQTAIGFCRGQR